MPKEPTQGLAGRDRITKRRRKLYVLAYEDNHASPQYFEALRDSDVLYDSNKRIELVSLKRPANDTKSAPKYVFKTLKKYKETYQLEPGDALWMIVDRDDWALEEWLDKCTQEGNFHLAVTNPCFELWLLLHFFNVEDFDETVLFTNPKRGKRRRYLDDYLNKNLTDGYKKNDILPERFVREAPLQKALAQARALDRDDILAVLGSHNYKLIDRLLHD